MSTVENVHGDFVIHNCLAPAAYLQSWITCPPDKSPYIQWMSIRKTRLYPPFQQLGPELQKSTKDHGKPYSILVCLTTRVFSVVTQRSSPGRSVA